MSERFLFMRLGLLAFAFILGTTGAKSDPLINKDLPFSPIQNGHIIVASGLDFESWPWQDKNFDPSKEMPNAPGGKNSIVWVSTPADYVVTDEQMLGLWEKKPNEPLYHSLEVIRYGEKHPWKVIDQVIILLFDHKIFCISFGDFESGFSIDARLEMQAAGKIELNVGQYESGTGAFNSHAYFELTVQGPKLIRLSKGGRGR